MIGERRREERMRTLEWKERLGVEIGGSEWQRGDRSRMKRIGEEGRGNDKSGKERMGVEKIELEQKEEDKLEWTKKNYEWKKEDRSIMERS